MGHAYYDIAFTDNVKAFQTKSGSRAIYGASDQENLGDVRLGRSEVEFINAADHFFQASVGETGWPYVQHRGGPAGFLKVIDRFTIGFADLSGNQQFISLGNLSKDGRVALIIFDWTTKRRLKIMGRVAIVDARNDRNLVKKLAFPGYGRPERGYVIRVEGYDWNCPQHITQRYTRAQIEAELGILRTEVAEMREVLSSQVGSLAAANGNGTLDLVVRAMRQISPTVRVFELGPIDGSNIPAISSAGSYIEIAARRDNGDRCLLRYPVVATNATGVALELILDTDIISNDPVRKFHLTWQLGTTLRGASLLSTPVDN